MSKREEPLVTVHHKYFTLVFHDKYTTAFKKFLAEAQFH